MVINWQNMGVGAASLVGVSQSRGKYIVGVDADDYGQPPFLYMLYSFLKFNPEFVGVSCDYFRTDNEERILSVEFARNGLACGPMLRTSYLELIESYNPERRIFEEKDLLERMEHSKIYYVPLPLYNYVRRGNSLTDRNSRDHQSASNVNGDPGKPDFGPGPRETVRQLLGSEAGKAFRPDRT